MILSLHGASHEERSEDECALQQHAVWLPHELLMAPEQTSRLALEPLHALDERMPAEDQRHSEPVHAQVGGLTVVHRRHVARGELQVVIDLVAERETEPEVVQLFALDAIQASLAAGHPGHVD